MPESKRRINKNIDTEVMEVARILGVPYDDLLALKNGEIDPTPEMVKAMLKIAPADGVLDNLVTPFKGI